MPNRTSPRHLPDLKPEIYIRWRQEEYEFPTPLAENQISTNFKIPTPLVLNQRNPLRLHDPRLDRLLNQPQLNKVTTNTLLFSPPPLQEPLLLDHPRPIPAFTLVLPHQLDQVLAPLLLVDVVYILLDLLLQNEP